jgi:hypothetical protein
MTASYKPHHWTPIEMHGVIPVPQDGDIEGAVARAVQKMVPRRFRQSTSNFKYTIHEGTQGRSIVFEVELDG